MRPQKQRAHTDGKFKRTSAHGDKPMAVFRCEFPEVTDTTAVRAVIYWVPPTCQHFLWHFPKLSERPGGVELLSSALFHRFTEELSFAANKTWFQPTHLSPGPCSSPRPQWTAEWNPARCAGHSPQRNTEVAGIFSGVFIGLSSTPERAKSIIFSW